MAASYQHRPVRELLERQLAPAKDHHGTDEGRHPRGDHEHRRDHFERHGLAEHRRNAVGPGSRGVDDHRCLERAGACPNSPCRALTRDVGRVTPSRRRAPRASRPCAERPAWSGMDRRRHRGGIRCRPGSLGHGGHEARSSAASMSSSWRKPDAFSSSTRARKLSNSSWVSATST